MRRSLTASAQATPHQPAAGLLEPRRAIQTRGALVAGFDFEMKRPDAELARARQSEAEQLATEPMSAGGRHEVEIVDEPVAAAVFDAVAQGDDDVSDGLALSPKNLELI